MKKLILIFFVLSSLLISCKSTENLEAPAPDWIYPNHQTANTKDGYYAVGSAKLDTYEKSLKVATIRAKKEIAEMLKTEIHTNLNIRKTDDSKVESVNLLEETSIKSKERVKNTKVEDTYTAKDGTVYVLLHYIP